jgi:hypothetical protein
MVACVEDLEDGSFSILYVPVPSVAPGTAYVISLSSMNIQINQ